MPHHITDNPPGFISPACVDERGRLSGFVHSFEMGSAVDGPGMRFVLFMSGCQFRCLYCHNPDTFKMHNGHLMTVEQVIGEISEYAVFLRFAGGLTISGGEPLMQAHYIREIFYLAKNDLHLHTTLDTQGFLAAHLEDEWFNDVDLVLLDIKHIDPDKHLALTSQPLQPTLDFAHRLSSMGKKMWIRYVLVPGYTDGFDDVERLAAFVTTLQGVERVEVLPFHKMGEDKWNKLDYDYRLKDVSPPDAALLQRVIGQFSSRGLYAC
ncbi:MAG: pyruvate formate-lyase 1-activating enzyme [Zetaproteobacteria bacterium CG06_land_8_20_14_3_00_59_53]|nr:MAG: pyruvate formate-lyase 1-activating enzyme [Zetaproteobacteria bacterium CG2_30_59_37]PIO89265.1 MAG: pyruvate formate-lyase 1-activating enzyme [Zetaproteobacteria bacterium CG23_combo_of_CG06-09_8_20_14_all_59_86]PIQ66201.1 MAG: pyruvate formate-lyase 1-activating enzyme [Zetaproteobacteria bacterium CG11_big_fil_rev_8_21_14_0_20_59_439]PIU70543.1 MAG: pyruvate formate-lyase 1-activating enzyme [Zetaproteobacteria bacterium CG06_land_8_20_14_3_00_59_53]PIU97962.1 MAG: pyruvate formate